MKDCLKNLFVGAIALWTSRKLWMTLIGISIMWGIYWHSAFHITQLSSNMEAAKLVPLLPILNEMFQTMMWGVVTAVGLYLGFTTLDKFTRGTTGLAQMVSNFSASTNRDEVIETRSETITHNIKVEGQPGAPEVKPWSLIDS